MKDQRTGPRIIHKIPGPYDTTDPQPGDIILADDDTQWQRTDKALAAVLTVTLLHLLLLLPLTVALCVAAWEAVL